MPSFLSQTDDRTPSIDIAVQLLKEGDFQSRWNIAKTLATMGEAAVAPLLELLQTQEESDWELLWFTARILGSLDCAAAIEGLIQLLSTTDHPDVAAMAVTALTNFGSRSIPVLGDLLNQPPTRQIAMEALAQLRHPEVVPLLLTGWDDPQPEIRRTAIEALSHFYRDPMYCESIQTVLHRALSDLDPGVRRAAVMGIGVQAGQSPAVDAAAAVGVLQPLLWDLNLEVCCQTVIALTRIGQEPAVELLDRVLQSPHTPVALQLEIIRGLVWMGTQSALDALQQFLLDASQIHSDSLLLEAIAVLGRSNPTAQPKATQLLLSLLESDHAIVQTSQGKQQIAFSLGQLNQAAAIEAVIHLLADPNASVRFHAVAALKHLADHGTRQHLQTLVNQTPSPELRAGIAWALQEWQLNDVTDELS